jgi:hypothetical protein
MIPLTMELLSASPEKYESAFWNLCQRLRAYRNQQSSDEEIRLRDFTKAIPYFSQSIHEMVLCFPKCEHFTDREVETYFQPIAVDPGRIQVFAASYGSGPTPMKSDDVPPKNIIP